MATRSVSSTNSSAKVVDALARALADSYALAVKTQNFHWNVTGPQFRDLHLMFEEQYKELAAAIDVVAERIRALGAPAPGGLGAFQRLATIKDEDGRPDARGMVERLAADHALATKTLRAVLAVAEETGDDATADLAIERLAAHDKTSWMLRAVLG